MKQRLDWYVVLDNIYLYIYINITNQPFLCLPQPLKPAPN